MQKRKKMKRLLSMLLSILILISCVPTTVFAGLSYLFYDTENEEWKYRDDSRGIIEIRLGDYVANYNFTGELYKDKATTRVISQGEFWCEYINAKVVKIDGDKIYVCTNHDTTTPANGLCTTCGRDSSGNLHTHNWIYTENGATLTAQCSGDGDCTIENGKTIGVPITLSATSPTYSGSAITKASLFSGMDFSAFNTATGNNLSLSDIELYAASDITKTSNLSEVTEAGSYVAYLTVEGKTATCNVTVSPSTPTSYTISKAETLNGRFTVSAESAAKDTEITITPTPNSGYEVDTVSVKDEDNNTVTVTNNKFVMPEANVTVTVTFKVIITPGTGEEKVTETNKASSSTPDTKITGINVSKDIKLTETEQAAIDTGKDVNIFLEVSDASVVEADKTAVIVKATTESYTIGKYIDIDLFSMIEGDESSKRAITETENKITITIKLSADLINNDNSKTREYSVIRLHDGESERLAATFNPETGEISFGTDRFSTYAIVYKDTPTATTPETTTPETTVTPTTPEATTPNVPDTGDTTPLSMMIFFMIFSACGIVVFKRKREN